MKLILIILFWILAGCTPTDYSIKEGSSWISPYFKYTELSGTLKIQVRFHADCRYPELREECEGDWNKLIYYGTFNQHNDGAAFVWKPEGVDRHLTLGYYLWYDKKPPYVSQSWGKIMNIETDTWYTLEIDLRTGVDWYVNGVKVGGYSDKNISGRWVSNGWFGGADLEGRNCNAIQKVTYEIIR
jgi:hypothetical protein